MTRNKVGDSFGQKQPSGRGEERPDGIKSSETTSGDVYHPKNNTFLGSQGFDLPPPSPLVNMLEDWATKYDFEIEVLRQEEFKRDLEHLKAELNDPTLSPDRRLQILGAFHPKTTARFEAVDILHERVNEGSSRREATRSLREIWVETHMVYMDLAQKVVQESLGQFHSLQPSPLVESLERWAASNEFEVARQK